MRRPLSTTIRMVINFWFSNSSWWGPVREESHANLIVLASISHLSTQFVAHPNRDRQLPCGRTSMLSDHIVDTFVAFAKTGKMDMLLLPISSILSHYPCHSSTGEEG